MDGSRPFERIFVLSEISKNYVQILALAAAGIWVVFTFVVKDWPSREAQFDVETEMTWTAGPTPSTCFGDWTVTLTNQSSRRVRVARADIRLWSFRAPAVTGEIPAFVDLRRMKPRDGKKFLFNRMFTDRADPMVGPYPSKSKFAHTYEWVFAREPRDQWVVLELELFADQEGTKSLWTYSEWSQRCTEAASDPHP